MLGLGWLNGNTFRRWRQGSSRCLEEELQASPVRIAEALNLLRAWANERGLLPSETDCVARTPQRQTLHVSRSGDPAVEARCRTRWVSPALSEKQRERLCGKEKLRPSWW